MTDLKEALERFSARLPENENPILGQGGTATVYHVIVNDEHYALKIVPQEHCYILEREILWLQWQKIVKEIKNIARLKASAYLKSGSLCALLSPVGKSIKSVSREYIPEVCCVISGLHCMNYRHGDAKIANFIVVDEKIVVIDFGFAKYYTPQEITLHVKYDMYRIAASFLGLDDSSDLDNDPDELITDQTQHIDIIQDALNTYINSGYSEHTAKQFGLTLRSLST